MFPLIVDIVESSLVFVLIVALVVVLIVVFVVDIIFASFSKKGRAYFYTLPIENIVVSVTVINGR
jgi:hypothetical protein